MRQKAVIIDIDGTFANSPQPSDDHRKFNGDICWQTWLRSTQYSLSHEWCYDIIAGLGMLGYKIVYLTARHGDEEGKKITEDWLKRHSPIANWDLYMRDPDDLRPDNEQKKSVLLNQIANKYDIVCAIDDKKINCDMFRELGIPALHCADY